MYYLVCVRKRVSLREDCVCASGSVVEHLLAKEGAAGSIPVSRFFNAKKQHPKRVLFFALNEPNPGLEGSKSRLPARSLLLQSRVIHRMTATRLALFIKKNLKGCCFFVFIGRKPADEVDAKASTSYTAKGAVFLH